MKSYWSCSKLADWIRGTLKPPYGTREEWAKWEKEAKTKHFRYWLAEEGLDHLQNIICWPINRLNNVRIYIKNRWFDKSHAMTSNLKRGQWYDFDHRLLHVVFDELVNFVEIELAWMQVISSDDEYKAYNLPWYLKVFRTKEWRCPEAGIAHLKWASDLRYDEDLVGKEDSRRGQLTPQAVAARETLELYNWWKDDRPKRLDPDEASGWIKYCDDLIKKDGIQKTDFFDSAIINDDNHDESKKILDASRQIEQEQEEEDTSMLIRLVKVRQYLWT
ncbi:MAG: hypothetical protein P1U39_00340 [Legionellaceae bacterium]|nr:hypothetical protein [Legionellaceae bacterium]